MNKFCPNCGNNVIRIKRTFKDKLFTSILDSLVVVRRYQCHRCEWTGLKRKDLDQKLRPSA